MSDTDSTVDRRIFRAYQQVKSARLDGDYQAIVRWMTVMDRLLDERLGRVELKQTADQRDFAMKFSAKRSMGSR